MAHIKIADLFEAMGDKRTMNPPFTSEMRRTLIEFVILAWPDEKRDVLAEECRCNNTTISCYKRSLIDRGLLKPKRIPHFKSEPKEVHEPVALDKSAVMAWLHEHWEELQ